MSLKDKEKWDNKYQQKKSLLEHREASLFLRSIIKYTHGTNALDLACGTGRNTLYLAQNGFDIDAIDISKIALTTLDKELKQISLTNKVNTILSDLDMYTPKKDYYDLFVMTNYLDKALIERSKKSMKKESIFFIETYMEDKENEKKDSNKNYLLKRDELKQIFKNGYEVLFYKEFDNEPHELYKMKKQAIAARKKRS